MAGASNSNSRFNDLSKPTKKSQFANKNSIINQNAMIDDQKSSISGQRGTSQGHPCTLEGQIQNNILYRRDNTQKHTNLKGRSPMHRKGTP